ncbi:MAG: YhcH/YjgK/YiaL family protein [Chitinophagaceae bacterium]
MIKNIFCAGLIVMAAYVNAQSKKSFTKAEAAAWYGQYKWLQGLKIMPDLSIDQQEFAKQYHKKKKWWDEAIAYIKNTDMAGLAAGNYPIDGEDVFVKVTEAVSKDIDSSRWESHHNYHDIHYIISGKEMIGITAVNNVTAYTSYDSTRDILFYKGDGPYFLASPDRFFIIFSNQAHRPFIKVGGYENVKRIVIKVRNVYEKEAHGKLK